MKSHSVIEFYQAGQDFSYANKLVGQINSCDLATALGKVARRTSNSAADVQQMHVRPQAHETSQLLYRLAAAHM